MGHIVVLCFTYLRNLQNIFCKWPHQFAFPLTKLIRLPFAPHPCQHSLFAFFLMMAGSNNCEVISHWGLICISLISSEEHLFMCWLAICMSSLEECSSWVFCLFFYFFGIELGTLLIYHGY